MVADTVSFSSRRRHARFDCDWSSDVCSSDLSVTPCLLTANADGVSSSCTVMFSANTLGSYTIKASYTPSSTYIHAASNSRRTNTSNSHTTSTTLYFPDSTPANSPATCTVRVADTDSGTKTAPQGTVGF